jgi:hypothetical protein
MIQHNFMMDTLGEPEHVAVAHKYVVYITVCIYFYMKENMWMPQLKIC